MISFQTREIDSHQKFIIHPRNVSTHQKNLIPRKVLNSNIVKTKINRIFLVSKSKFNSTMFNFFILIFIFFSENLIKFIINF